MDFYGFLLIHPSPLLRRIHHRRMLTSTEIDTQVSNFEMSLLPDFKGRFLIIRHYPLSFTKLCTKIAWQNLRGFHWVPFRKHRRQELDKKQHSALDLAVLSGSVGAVEALGIDARWDPILESWERCVEKFEVLPEIWIQFWIHLANCPFGWNDVSPFFGQNT